MIRAFFGGSFDPVHVGHVAMADHVLSAGLADVVHIVPAWLSPHKVACGAPARDRLAMVRLAFPQHEHLVVETREMANEAACFSVDTLATLQRSYPDDEWLVVIGSDQLASLRSWHRVDRLTEMAALLVFGRRGNSLSVGAIQAAGLAAARVKAVPEFHQPVSSTAVRALVAQGAADESDLVAGGVPQAVAQYIIAHKSYGPSRNGVSRVSDPD